MLIDDLSPLAAGAFVLCSFFRLASSSLTDAPPSTHRSGNSARKRTRSADSKAPSIA
jgi:hypothetical protein